MDPKNTTPTATNDPMPNTSRLAANFTIAPIPRYLTCACCANASWMGMQCNDRDYGFGYCTDCLTRFAGRIGCALDYCPCDLPRIPRDADPIPCPGDPRTMGDGFDAYNLPPCRTCGLLLICPTCEVCIRCAGTHGTFERAEVAS